MEKTRHICSKVPRALLVAWTLWFWISVAQAEVYHVNARGGSDISSGLSEKTPWKTIGFAAATMGPGDTVIVAPGKYDERVKVSKSGLPGKPITYKASGAAVTKGFTVRANHIGIIGFEITDTPDVWDHGTGIHLEGRDCEISGNYLHDVTRLGIRVFAHDPDSPLVTGNTVRDNRIIRAGLAGIEVYGRNNLIENNDISHILQRTPGWAEPGPKADADGMRFFGSGHVIRKNRIHDITMADPGNMNPHIDCFQTWGPAYDILLEQNYCENLNDRMQGFMIGSERKPIRNITIRNNVIRTFRFVNVYDCRGFSFVNNLCMGDLMHRGKSGYGVELHRCPDATVENNIFHNVGSHLYPYLFFDRDEGLKVGNNLVYMSDGMPAKRTEYIPRPTDLWQIDPKIEIAGGLKVSPDSPVKGKGRAIPGLTHDFYGNPRGKGPNIDIGPFEHMNKQ